MYFATLQIKALPVIWEKSIFWLQSSFFRFCSGYDSLISLGCSVRVPLLSISEKRRNRNKRLSQARADKYSVNNNYAAILSSHRLTCAITSLWRGAARLDKVCILCMSGSVVCCNENIIVGSNQSSQTLSNPGVASEVGGVILFLGRMMPGCMMGSKSDVEASGDVPDVDVI